MSFSPKRIAIFGASGAIGSAILNECVTRYEGAQLFAFSRSLKNIPDTNHTQCFPLCLEDEDSLQTIAHEIHSNGGLDLVFVAVGQLHGATLQPEKTLRSLNRHSMMEIYQANAILPAVIMKHFLRILRKEKKSVFAAISARVGSISDNRLGGWYSYRASKAALNMLIKCASIEMARTHANLSLVGVHPGTVDSALSKPFQRHVPEGKLFSPSYSAGMILNVLETLSPEQSGKCFAYDGSEIHP